MKQFFGILCRTSTERTRENSHRLKAMTVQSPWWWPVTTAYDKTQLGSIRQCCVENADPAGPDCLFCSWNQNQSHMVHFVVCSPGGYEITEHRAASKTTFPSKADLVVSGLLFFSQRQLCCYVVYKKTVARLVQTERDAESHCSWLISGMKVVAGINLHLTAEGGGRMQHGGHEIFEQNIHCHAADWRVTTQFII